MAVTKTETMRRVTTGDRLIRFVFWWRRVKRLYFPSPAEVQFVQIMRGRALTFPFIKSTKTGFPLTLLWRGRLLRNELVEREVKAGRFYLDFGTPGASYHKGIEIDGRKFHDVVADQQRDEQLAALGWKIMRIPAWRLKREPRLVYVEVMRYLKA